MSQIGHPIRTVLVEPLKVPVPEREPAPAPAPQEVPLEQPVGV